MFSIYKVIARFSKTFTHTAEKNSFYYLSTCDGQNMTWKLMLDKTSQILAIF